MDRRFFLKNTMSVSIVSSLLLSGGIKSLLSRQSKHPNRVLVLIQLDGGNDGLNTVIPLDQYPNLIKARQNIMINEKKVLSLYDSSITTLHPAMSGVRDLYNNKSVSIIQNVGYKNPDLSHFKAIDIWHSASAADTISTGWLGRFLDKGQNIHDGLSSADPPAIQMGSSLTKNLQGESMNMGMAIKTIDSFYDLQTAKYEPPLPSRLGDQLSFLQASVSESRKYLYRVKEAASVQQNQSKLYPPPNDNPLADQLKIIARLIGGGLQTKIYITSLKGFDTHSSQVDPYDSSKGVHADLLSKLSTAIAAFQDDLHLMGKQEDVLGMTYSEFGRRIKSNSSYGSDHGTAAPIMLFGSKLKGGLIGKNPEIASGVNFLDNLPFQTDFRSVYSSILKGWFHLPDTEIASTVMGEFPQLDLFKS